MTPLLSAAAASMCGELNGADGPFEGVSTDTRTLRDGELFFALSGPNFTGEDFVREARDKGAAGAVVRSVVDEDIPQIAVADTRRALGALGSHWRQQQSAVVVGITGSNGKTTLKEMTAACLAAKGSTLATAGNFNNDIGMPLMLLRMSASHRYAVLELGANHIGEIAYLTSLARPDVVVITNAAAAHLEGFGSLEGVAKGKGEILQGMPRPEFAILNADDEFFAYWSGLAGDAKVVSFGLSEHADVRGEDIVIAAGSTRFTLHVKGQAVPVTLPLAGRHNVRNACAAAAVASALGISLGETAAALESVMPVGGRLQPMAGQSGATLFDDSYNANPRSVIAAGEFLASLPGAHWMVLGDMKELGADEIRLHAEVGRGLKKAGVDRLFATGDLCRHTSDAFGAGASWFDSVDALAADVLGQLAEDVNVLVKGSRSMRMERVVEALRQPADMRAEA
jgi:UDP-N-acetylmuramoyl-tripeptide--D-alanyl-D-alanine ligase